MEIKEYLEEGTKESSTRLKSFIWCVVFIVIDLAITTAICMKIVGHYELLLSLKFLIFIGADIIVHFIMIYFPQYLKQLLENGMTLFRKK